MIMEISHNREYNLYFIKNNIMIGRLKGSVVWSNLEELLEDLSNNNVDMISWETKNSMIDGLALKFENICSFNSINDLKNKLAEYFI